MNLIQQLEQEKIARLNKDIPEFAPGDTVVVSVRVVEGTRSRLQAYEGVVIARRNRGLNSNFIVRKISSGEGVERTFQLYSPTVEKIEVKRRGDVRRAKLYYLRGLTGKAARIKEKLPARKGSSKRFPPMPSERSDGIFYRRNINKTTIFPIRPLLNKHSHPFKQNLQTKRYTVSYPPY